MKKHVLGLMIFTVCLMLLLGGCTSEKNDKDAADTIFENGMVFTADNNNTVASCVAIKDGKIIFVGSDSDGEKYKGENTDVINLSGQMLIPGMMDTHQHIPGPTLAELYMIDLSGIYEINETMKTIEDYIKAHPEQEMYYGLGFNTTAFTEGDELNKGPSKERLDAIESEKPIAITAYDGHSTWVNSAALEKFNITADTEVGTGGFIEVNDKTGEPWGILREVAMTLIPMQEFTEEEAIAALEEYQKTLNSYGITTVMGATAIITLRNTFWPELQAMEKDGALTLRIKGSYPMDPDGDVEKQIAEAVQLKEEINSEMVQITTAKFFADGVVDSKTAFMKEPYTDDPTTRSELQWDTEKLAKAFTLANENDLQIHIHAIGDAATAASLDAFEAAQKVNGDKDYRNSITHLILVDLNDIPRFKAANVIASVQPYWIMKFPGYWDTVEYPFLGERAEHMYPLKSFIDEGVMIGSSSDSPVTPYPYPLVAIEAGVTRNVTDGYCGPGYEISDMDDSPETILWPEQRVSVADMIKSFTINNAHLTRTEDTLGSIEVGKIADLVILDKNILEINPTEIETAKVVRTYLNGKIVYDINE